MATKIWRGDAVATSDVWTFVLGGTLEVGDILNITIGAKTYTYTLATTTIATEAAALVVLLQALSTTTYPEFAGLTWAYVSAGTFTATGTAGVKFTITVTTTEAGGGAADAQTFAVTNTTVASGPNFIDNAQNWGGTAIAAADDLVFENSAVDCIYGMATYAAVTFGSITIRDTYTGKLGLPRMSGSGTTAYVEYRQRYFQMAGCTNGCAIGNPNASTQSGFASGGIGSSRLQLDFGAGAVTASIYGSGAAIESGVAPIQLKGSALTIAATGGQIGVAMFASETSTLSAFRMSGQNTEVELGSGVSIGAITFVKSAGKLTVNSNCGATLKHRGGETIIAGTATVTTLDGSEGGDIRYRSTGTLTAGTIGNATHLDWSQDLRARTVTNLTVRKGAKLTDREGTVTFTNPIAFQCNPFKDCTIDFGPSINLQRS